MAINSCSINSFTINSLACRRRQFVQPPVNQGKSHVQHYRYQNWEGRPEDENFATFDQDTILMTLTINGQTIEKSFNNSIVDIIPMITVNNININSDTTTSIELINLKVEKL